MASGASQQAYQTQQTSFNSISLHLCHAIHLPVQVSLSSLNRHAVATREDVGTPKAVCLEVSKLNLNLCSDPDNSMQLGLLSQEQLSRLLGASWPLMK